MNLRVVIGSILLTALLGCSQPPQKHLTYDEWVKHYESETRLFNGPGAVNDKKLDAKLWDDHNSFTAETPGDPLEKAAKLVKISQTDQEFFDRHFEEYRKLREQAKAQGWLNTYRYQEMVEAISTLPNERIDRRAAQYRSEGPEQ